MKPIAVLGCGPAGLLAAYGIGLTGQPLAIFSNTEKSKLGGAQFLHKPIYGIHDEDNPDAVVTYHLHGTAAAYQEKVYGNDPVPFVSFSNVKDGQQQSAWNLLKTYDWLWGEFGHTINEAQITPAWVDENEDKFALILSTVPLVALCRHRVGATPPMPKVGDSWYPMHHRFTVQDIAIHPDNLAPIHDNTILYDGTREHSWYRSSLLFGVGGTEWSPQRSPVAPVRPLYHDRKPIATNCDCFPQIVRLGRRGTWQKGVLTHHAFVGALEAVLPERKKV
jgi:hypothetical protein